MSGKKDLLDYHWAVCDKDGRIRYDADGQAEIWDKRTTARNRSAKLLLDEGEQLHVERVEIR